MRIIIKNIPKKFSEEELNSLISNLGSVVSLKILTDSDSGESRGIAFVEMKSREEALYVIEKLNGEPLEDNILIAEVANPKK